MANAGKGRNRPRWRLGGFRTDWLEIMSKEICKDPAFQSIDRAPAEIFLITGCDVDELAEVDWNEVTWCAHRAEKGIRYVREDLVSKPQDREPTE